MSVSPSLAILGPILREAFTPPPDIPLPVFASQNVFLDRRMTTKPGFYDPQEFLWTWEFQEMMRLRAMFTFEHPADGAICLCDPEKPGAKRTEIQRIAWMKSTVAGVTEAALNGIRYYAKHDPQNVIFAIDSRNEAGNLNEIRLQPTLQRLGQQIFTADQDDFSKYLIKLKRMLIYFLGSYSSAAFQNKMAETGITDELEDHSPENGKITTVAGMDSRLRSAPRPLHILISRPKLQGGPIHIEYAKGTQCVYEIPCPHCTAANNNVPTGFQQLLQENMTFTHCKDMYGEWDFDRVSAETFFRCGHCGKPITEEYKRWFNERTRRRWRITNFKALPGCVSFHMSDFYGYHPEVRWGAKLAVEYIRSKGDQQARQAYRNLHEGLPWEVRETKTSIDDLFLLRGAYRWKTLPWKPLAILLGGDVGKEYVKGSIVALRADGEAAVIDKMEGLHPNDFAAAMRDRTYLCPETGAKLPIAVGFVDSKYRHEDVYKTCLTLPGRLYPSAGNPSHVATGSIEWADLGRKGWPAWLKLLTYLDRDAKSDLYLDRITGWVNYIRSVEKCRKEGRHGDIEKVEKPNAQRLWFPEDIKKDDWFLIEHGNERLIDITPSNANYLPAASRQFEWKRVGPNHAGDGTKVALRGWAILTRHART